MATSSRSGLRVSASTSKAARAAFAAASACGTVFGSRPRALRVDSSVSGTKATGRDLRRGLEPDQPGALRLHPGQGEPAGQGRGHVVRVPLDLGGQAQQAGVVDALLAVEAQRPGGDDAGHDRGRGGTQPAPVRDARCAGHPQARRRHHPSGRSTRAGSGPPGAGRRAGPCARPRRPRTDRDRRRSPAPRPRRAGSGRDRSSRSPGPRLALLAGTRTRTASER